jgi:hypothetical protein
MMTASSEDKKIAPKMLGICSNIIVGSILFLAPSKSGTALAEIHQRYHSGQHKFAMIKPINDFLKVARFLAA